MAHTFAIIQAHSGYIAFTNVREKIALPSCVSIVNPHAVAHSHEHGGEQRVVDGTRWRLQLHLLDHTTQHTQFVRPYHQVALGCDYSQRVGCAARVDALQTRGEA